MLVARSQSQGRTLYLSDHAPTERMLGCAPDGSSAHYIPPSPALERAAMKRAYNTYCRTNATTSAFPSATVVAVRTALDSVPPPDPSKPCFASRGVIEVTRVGFDSTRAIAVAGFVLRVGAGPYPNGCAYSEAGGFVFRREPNGPWRIVGTLPGYST